MEKLARADIIAEQRHSIAEELQRMRKDIAQQEAWVKASPSPVHASHTCVVPRLPGMRHGLSAEHEAAAHAEGHCAAAGLGQGAPLAPIPTCCTSGA